MIISDGKGSGKEAGVNDNGQLLTASTIEAQDKFNNRQGKTWSVTSSSAAVGVNDYIFYFKNTGTETYTVTDIRAYAAAATTLSIDHVSGTPTFTAGTDLTPVNRNLNRADAMSATIKSDTNTTGLTDLGQLFFMRLDTANKTEHLKTSSNIIIPPGQVIAIETSVATTVTMLVSFTLLEDNT